MEKQGQLPKKFKYNENFIEAAGQSKWTIFFKRGLRKFLKKFPAFTKSTLSSNYLKITLK